MAAHVSRFIFLRTLASCYAAAFLSLLAQADGLFGCSGVWPLSPGGGLAYSVFLLLALAGSLLSGAAVLAMRRNHDCKIFSALFGIYALEVFLAPAVYPQEEDKLLLEAGVVGILLAAPGGGAVIESVRKVGRQLAAWLIFRFAFSYGARRVLSECDVWRNLSAMHHVNQLFAFPLPPSWALFMAPPLPIKFLTVLILYGDLFISPLLLVPSQAVRGPAAVSQIFLLVLRSLLANHGWTNLTIAALAFALLDDGFHSCLWNPKMLKTWGCRRPREEEEEEEDSESSCLPAVLLIFVGYLGLIVGLLSTDVLSSASSSVIEVLRWSLLAVGLAAALGSAGVIASRSSGGGSRSTLLLGLMALGLIAHSAGFFSLCRGLSASEPWSLAGLSRLAEKVHLGHGYGDDADLCPDPAGRWDVVIQGAFKPLTSWTDLSSRFLPVQEERRPMLLQPFVPILDRELWRATQKRVKSKKSKMNKWVTRLLQMLAFRENGASWISHGAWEGLSAWIYGSTGLSSSYPKAVLPLEIVRAHEVQHQWDTDVRSNQWFVIVSKKPLKQFEQSELPESQDWMRCTPSPIGRIPVAEALAALFLAGWVAKVVLFPPDKKRGDDDDDADDE